MRAFAFLFAGFSLVAVAQTPAAAPAAPVAFEVATIKQSPPMDPGKMMSGQIRVGVKIDGARAEYHFLSLADLICAAYKIKSYQLNGPDWMKTTRWDIQATLPEGVPAERANEMLQALLKDRFKLEIHRDTKDHNVYALVQGKNGHKLKDAEPDPPAAPAAGEAPAEGAPPPPKEEAPKDGKGAPSGTMTVNGEKMSFKQTSNGAIIRGGDAGTTKISMNNGMMHMEMAKVAMPQFAEMLTRFVDRPVTDETQLKGKYQVAIDISMADMMNVAKQAGMGGAMGGPPAAPGGSGGGPGPAESASDPGGSASIFTAVEQMGLKLTPRKGPVEMIVVDRLEKAPTDN